MNQEIKLYTEEQINEVLRGFTDATPYEYVRTNFMEMLNLIHDIT